MTEQIKVYYCIQITVHINFFHIRVYTCKAVFIATFSYCAGSPELVDWIGQQRQVDAAKRAGVAHVVMVGSMETTKAAPDEFMGCFKYKRQSEDYLIESGLTYTIVNPCMLVDGEEGTRELVFSKSDKLHFSGSSKEYQVARKTVAEVVFQTLLVPEAKNKAFDLLGHVEIPPTKAVDYVAVFKEMTPGL